MGLELSRGTIAALFLAAVIIAGVGIFYTMQQLKNPTAAFSGIAAEEGEPVPGEAKGQAVVLIQPSLEDGEVECGDGEDNDADGVIDCEDPTCGGWC